MRLLSSCSAGLLAWIALPAFLIAQRVEVVQRDPQDTLGNTYRLPLPEGKPQGVVVLLSNWGNHYCEFDWQRVAIQGPLNARGMAVLMLSIPRGATTCWPTDPWCSLTRFSTK